jgi:hypothetical protein
MTRLQQVALAWSCAAALADCERAGAGYTNPSADSSASPAPSASASLAPSTCVTSPSATVLVGISSGFGEFLDPQFGELAGYADVTTAEPALAAAVTATTSDTVQFVNLESASVNHSAVGFPAAGSGASGFPAVPYAFPSAAASPSANTTIGTTFWSTGRIAPSSSGNPCYSQAFTLPSAGTYYFGDFDYYNTITSLRDVIVVTSSADRRPHRNRR